MRRAAAEVKPVRPRHRRSTQLARRRVYLHPNRRTSLGLSLLEAMHLGMPVVALTATEAPRAVPPEAGVTSLDADELARAIRALMADPEYAAERGRDARRYATRASRARTVSA